jgi:hypothetical protein
VPTTAEMQYTYSDLISLPPVVPVAVCDHILDIGQTLSKRLRASGQYPVRILPGLGRHHRVSTADLLIYLGHSDVSGRSEAMDGTIPDVTHSQIKDMA